LNLCSPGVSRKGPVPVKSSTPATGGMKPKTSKDYTLPSRRACFVSELEKAEKKQSTK